MLLAKRVTFYLRCDYLYILFFSYKFILKAAEFGVLRVFDIPVL